MVAQLAVSLLEVIGVGSFALGVCGIILIVLGIIMHFATPKMRATSGKSMAWGAMTIIVAFLLPPVALVLQGGGSAWSGVLAIIILIGSILMVDVLWRKKG